MYQRIELAQCTQEARLGVEMGFVERFKQDQTTWIICGRQSPIVIEDEGKPYRPVVFFVLDSRINVLSFNLGRSLQNRSVLQKLLQQAGTAPLHGSPARPALVRVENAKLAELIRQLLPGCRVLVEPTPEVDVVFDGLLEFIFGGDSPDEPVPVSVVKDLILEPFFQVAADLYRRSPWLLIPGDDVLIRITATRLGLKGAIVYVINDPGGNHGFAVHRSEKDFWKYQDCGDLLQLGRSGSIPPFPPHTVLEYDSLSAFPESEREQLLASGLPVAGPQAYPVLRQYDTAMMGVPIDPEILHQVGAICHTLNWLIDNEPRVSDPHTSLPGIRCRCRIPYFNEEIPVSVTFL